MAYSLESGVGASGVGIVNADVNVVAIFKGYVARATDGNRRGQTDVARFSIANADAARAEDFRERAVISAVDDGLVELIVRLAIDHDAEFGCQLFLAAIVLHLEIQVGQHDVDVLNLRRHAFAQRKAFGNAAIVVVRPRYVVLLIGVECRQILAVQIGVFLRARGDAIVVLVVVNEVDADELRCRAFAGGILRREGDVEIA